MVCPYWAEVEEARVPPKVMQIISIVELRVLCVGFSWFFGVHSHVLEIARGKEHGK